MTTAFRASAWRPHLSGSLQGFVDLLLPSGLVLHDCTVHEKDGRRWLGLPAKAQLDSDGQHRKDPTTGRRLYTPVAEIPNRATRDNFNEQALIAVDRLLGTGGEL